MSIIKKIIGDGITLNIVENDKFKSNYISVNFITNLKKENAAMDALLPLVLMRGTKSYPSMAKLNNKLDELYATSIATRCFKKGETHFFGFSSYILDNAYALDGCDILGEALEVLKELIYSPYLENGIFSKSYVEGEKKNLKDKIAAQINNKNSYAITRCYEEMCKNEPFGIQNYGTVEDVDAIDASKLYEYYKKVLKEYRIEIYYVGKLYDDLTKKIRSIICGERKYIEQLKTEVIRRADNVKEVDEDQPVTQGKLSLGFRTGKVLSDGDYYVFVLFNELFGSSPTSKLFMNVREKLSLCYYCKSIPEPQKGVMVVTAGIEVENKEIAQKEILRQLDCIKNGEITDDEMNAAISSVQNGYAELNDSPEAIESWYTGRMLAGLTDSPEEASERVKNVTKEQVILAASGITLDTVYFMRGTLKDDK